MARRSLEQRIAEVEGRAEELETNGRPQPTEVHRRTVEVFTHLLQMGKTFSGEEVPTHLRVLLKTLDRSRPVLEQELATVPEDQIVSFMTMIRDEINQIIRVAGRPIEEEQTA